MKNEVFALECRRRYAEDGLVVDASNGEFAHCPLPRGMGDTGYYLLHDDHQWQGLLQSKDIGRKCFFDYYARKFLVEGPFVEGYFELWDTYEKWSRGQWEKGKGWYKDDETGVCLQLTKEEAEERGMVPLAKGKGNYRDPETGEMVRLTKRQAEERGYVGSTSGRSLYKNPLTGEIASMTREEAAEAGWVGFCSGTATYKCPETGEVKRLTPEAAEQRGWIGVTAGSGTYKDPETGAKERMGCEEAKQRGWVHVQTGVKRTPRKVKCPHCGKEGGANIMPRHHFDNCKQRQD